MAARPPTALPRILPLTAVLPGAFGLRVAAPAGRGVLPLRMAHPCVTEVAAEGKEPAALNEAHRRRDEALVSGPKLRRKCFRSPRPHVF